MWFEFHRPQSKTESTRTKLLNCDIKLNKALTRNKLRPYTRYIYIKSQVHIRLVVKASLNPRLKGLCAV